MYGWIKGNADDADWGDKKKIKKRMYGWIRGTRMTRIGRI